MLFRSQENTNGKVPSTSVHVADVARPHVEALDSEIEGNLNFLAVSDGERGTRWERTIDVLNRNFPKAVKKGIRPNNGHTSTKRTKVYASHIEKVLVGSSRVMRSRFRVL